MACGDVLVELFADLHKMSDIVLYSDVKRYIIDKLGLRMCRDGGKLITKVPPHPSPLSSHHHPMDTRLASRRCNTTRILGSQWTTRTQYFEGEGHELQTHMLSLRTVRSHAVRMSEEGCEHAEGQWSGRGGWQPGKNHSSSNGSTTAVSKNPRLKKKKKTSSKPPGLETEVFRAGFSRPGFLEAGFFPDRGFRNLLLSSPPGFFRGGFLGMGFFDTVFVFDHFPSELDARPIGVIDQTEHVRRSAAPTANIAEARAQKEATKCWEYRKKNMSAERKKEVTRIHFDMPHSLETVGFDSKGKD